MPEHAESPLPMGLGPSHGSEVVLIDLHDLTSGQREESIFVERDASTGLLDVLNAFIATTPFPLR